MTLIYDQRIGQVKTFTEEDTDWKITQFNSFLGTIGET
jgi:hypothetical protein